MYYNPALRTKANGEKNSKLHVCLIVNRVCSREVAQVELGETKREEKERGRAKCCSNKQILVQDAQAFQVFSHRTSKVPNRSSRSRQYVLLNTMAALIFQDPPISFLQQIIADQIFIQTGQINWLSILYHAKLLDKIQVQINWLSIIDTKLLDKIQVQ